MVAEPYGLWDMPVPQKLGTFPTRAVWHPHNRSDAPNIWLEDLFTTIVLVEMEGL